MRFVFAVMALALSAPVGAAVIHSESGSISPDQELTRLSIYGEKPGFFGEDVRQQIQFTFRHDGKLAGSTILLIEEIHSHFYLNGQYAGGNDGAYPRLFPDTDISFGDDFFRGRFTLEPERTEGDPNGWLSEFHFGADVGYVLIFQDQGGPINWTLTFEAVPEADTWAMLIAGFGIMGTALRRNLNRPFRRHRIARVAV